MTESHSSIFLDKSNPEVFTALGKTQKKVAKALQDAGVSDAVVELCNLHISQVNGCHFCIDVHARKARKAGVPQQLLDMVASWRGSPLFSEEQKAALSLFEAATELPTPVTRLAVQENARKVFGDEATAALEWAAILINAYNRVSMLSEHPVKKRADK